MEPLLEVSELTKHFPVKLPIIQRLLSRERHVVHAVDAVSFALQRGEIGVYKLRFTDRSQPDDAEHVTAVQAQVDHLRLLLDVTQIISSSLATDEVLKHVIDGVIRVTQAQRGFLMMENPAGELEFKVARNFDRTALTTTGLTASNSVLNRVRNTGKAVVLSDTADFDPTESIVKLGLRSVLEEWLGWRGASRDIFLLVLAMLLASLGMRAVFGVFL